MSRILVADDNSNIQKMVALALKDEGIDVVAVGNGDAAIRKIPDLRPDLILADIFMPVRNGYEVCEFVKSDSRYMNTPVVLLVGAFDPLDEQETQRVRADGVLKKPFVPPDPLINMVKALLAKSNGQKPVPPVPVMVATPAKAAMPVQVGSAPASEPAPNSAVAVAPAEPLPPTQAKIKPPAQEAPAFLIPAPPAAPRTAKAEDPDEVVTSSRDPNLGEPFWATPAEPQEPQARSESETEPEDMIDMHSFGKDESYAEEEEEPTHFRPDTPNLDGADYSGDIAETTVSKNEVAAPQEAYRSQPPAAAEDESNLVMAESGSPEPSAPPASDEAPEIFKFDPALTLPDAPPSASSEEGSSDADGASLVELEPLESPLNEDIATSSRPAMTGSTADMPEKPLDSHEQVAPMELDLPALPNREAVITAATEAARLAFSELNTLPGSGASAGSSDGHARMTEHMDSLSTSTPAAAPSPEMIEAVVNRLLARMQPQIMEVVNREVLRPAIEEIVRQEMKKD